MKTLNDFRDSYEAYQEAHPKKGGPPPPEKSKLSQAVDRILVRHGAWLFPLVLFTTLILLYDWLQ